MKTLEGVELKLGECIEMPVNEIPRAMRNDYAYNNAVIGRKKQDRLVPKDMPKIHYCCVKNCYIESNHVHVERSRFYQRWEYIEAAIELYYQQVLMHLKPANYND